MCKTQHTNTLEHGKLQPSTMEMARDKLFDITGSELLRLTVLRPVYTDRKSLRRD